MSIFLNYFGYFLILLSFIFLLRKRSHYFALVAFFLLFEGFGLLQKFMLTGSFGSMDLGFIMLAFYFIGTIGYHKFSHRFRFSNYFIWLYLFLIIFITIYTISGQGQNTELTIKMMRRWLYFLMYLPAYVFFLNYDQHEKILKFVLIITVLGAILYVINNIYPLKFLSEYHATIQQQINPSMPKQTRVYGGLINGPIYMVAGAIIALLLQGNIPLKYSIWLWLSFVFLSLQPMLSWGRGYITGFIITIFCVILISKINPVKKISFLFSFIFLIIIGFGSISIIKYGDTTTFPILVIDRLNEGKKDISENEGTYNIRTNIVEERMKIINETPVFGCGFIHPDSGLYPEIENTVGNTHNGFIDILGNTGYAGMIMFILFTLLILKRCFFIMKQNVNPLYKALAVSTIGYIIQGYPHNLSTNSFNEPLSMALMSIMLALIEVGYLRMIYNETNKG